MRSRMLVTPLLVFATAAAGLGALTGAHRAKAVERVDFGTVRRSTQPAYDARLQPASAAPIKEFVLPITDDTIEIAEDGAGGGGGGSAGSGGGGVKYVGWTFGGTVPGPTLRVRQGDLVRITVVNRSPMPHSIDFHAARIPANVAYRSFNPGDSIRFEFVARDPGVFMVHCGTPPVLMHLMQGMYFAIIVDPRDGWGTTADKEFVIVQSEFYAKRDSTTAATTTAATRTATTHGSTTHGSTTHGSTTAPLQPDWPAALAKTATYVTFNGRAGQYKAHPLQVEVGDRVRFFVLNAGPSLRSDFHVVGAVFDRVYPDGTPRHVLEGVQTQTIPAGGGAVFETVFAKDASGEGLYPFVTHAFADAERGAVGIIQVGTPKTFATMNH